MRKYGRIVVVVFLLVHTAVQMPAMASQASSLVESRDADRDYRIAEFYRRSGNRGAAYFYYKLVLRRYPDSDHSRKAVWRILELVISS